MASPGGWLWPNVSEQDGAMKAIKGASQAAFIVSGITALVAVIALVGGKPVAGFEGWALVDAILMAVAGWRITKHSRAWAVVALVYWTGASVARVLSVSAVGAFGVVTIIILLAFVGGVRGTFALHKLRNGTAAREVSSPPR